MLKSLSILCSILGASVSLAAAQASVRVEPARPERSRSLQEQTATAAIRDYIESWASLRDAFKQNRADLLNRDFVGYAKDKMTNTIQQQSTLGIQTIYQDRSHDVQIVSYSLDGLSIELTDKVDYDMQLLVHDKVQATERQQASYIVVLTPSEVRWKVRVLQAAHD
jgi:hypothetical protein